MTDDCVIVFLTINVLDIIFIDMCKYVILRQRNLNKRAKGIVSIFLSVLTEKLDVLNPVSVLPTDSGY